MKRTPGFGLLAMPAMIIAPAVGRITGHAAAGAIAAGSAACIRLVNTIVGGTIALAIYAIWMTVTRGRRAESVQ